MNTIIFIIARESMVKQQVRTWDVFDPAVLALFDELSREPYVPPRFKHLAYSDAAIPLDNGHKLLPPREQGRILQALALKSTDRVLEIGCATGFLTTCFARLAHAVVALDIDPDMLEQAQRNTQAAGLQNITYKSGYAAKCWSPDGRFVGFLFAWLSRTISLMFCKTT